MDRQMDGQTDRWTRAITLSPLLFFKKNLGIIRRKLTLKVSILTF